MNRTKRQLVILAALTLLVPFTARALADHTSQHKVSQPTFPIRAAFYYPWYPETWPLGSHYTPTRGLYDSGDPAVVREHIVEMSAAKIRAGIASWFGQNTHQEQTRIPTLLNQAVGLGSLGHFKWALYYEKEGYGSPTVAEIAEDITFIRNRYGRHNEYLRVNRRPVLFVYGDETTEAAGCEMASRWEQANQTWNFYIVLKVFPGYRTCVDQPDSWHQYAGATPTDNQAPHSFTISPGFWHALEAMPRLDRDLARWRQNIRDMIASGASWQLVVSYNEWGEGTLLEDSNEFGKTYLDALRTDGVEP